MINDLIETWWNIWPLPSTELRKAIEVIEDLIADSQRKGDTILQMVQDYSVLTAERDALEVECEKIKMDWSQDAARLIAGRNEYQIAADKMAGEHKIERDGLGMKIDALALDAVRYRFIFAESERVDPVCALVWKKGEVRNSSEWVNSTGSVWMSKELDEAIAKEQGNDK